MEIQKIFNHTIMSIVIVCVAFLVMNYGIIMDTKSDLQKQVDTLQQQCDSLQTQIDYMVE